MDKEYNLDRVRDILKIVRSGSFLTEKSDEKVISYNNNDVTKEFNSIMDSWIASDYKKFGFLLGEMLLDISTTFTSVDDATNQAPTATQPVGMNDI